MDFHVRYWDVSEKEVVIRYWNSKFLAHTRSDDPVKAFNDEANELNLTKLIQISIDGLNSTLKFLSEIKKLRKKDELVSLIYIGSYNFHVIHGKFETGSESANWSLHKILKASFTLLHDTYSPRWLL